MTDNDRSAPPTKLLSSKLLKGYLEKQGLYKMSAESCNFLQSFVSQVLDRIIIHLSAHTNDNAESMIQTFVTQTLANSPQLRNEVTAKFISLTKDYNQSEGELTEEDLLLIVLPVRLIHSAVLKRFQSWRPDVNCSWSLSMSTSLACLLEVMCVYVLGQCQNMANLRGKKSLRTEALHVALQGNPDICALYKSLLVFEQVEKALEQKKAKEMTKQVEEANSAPIRSSLNEKMQLFAKNRRKSYQDVEKDAKEVRDVKRISGKSSIATTSGLSLSSMAVSTLTLDDSSGNTLYDVELAKSRDLIAAELSLDPKIDEAKIETLAEFLKYNSPSAKDVKGGDNVKTSSLSSLLKKFAKSKINTLIPANSASKNRGSQNLESPKKEKPKISLSEFDVPQRSESQKHKDSPEFSDNEFKLSGSGSFGSPINTSIDSVHAQTTVKIKSKRRPNSVGMEQVPPPGTPTFGGSSTIQHSLSEQLEFTEFGFSGSTGSDTARSPITYSKFSDNSESYQHQIVQLKNENLLLKATVESLQRDLDKSSSEIESLKVKLRALNSKFNSKESNYVEELVPIAK